MAIDRFGNVYKFMHISFSENLVTSYSINLLFINEPQCMESSLHTLLVAIAWPRYYVILRNNICGEFLPVSWLLLGNFLTYSWVFLMILENFFLVRDNFFPSRIVKSTQDTPRSHWDTVKKPMRRKQDYYDIVKKWQDMSNRQEVTRSVKSSRIFLKFSKKNLGASRFIKNCQEVSGSVRSVKKLFKKSPRRY